MDRLSLPLRHTPDPTAMPAHEGLALAALARSLQQAARAGHVRPLLGGRHFALMCATPDSVEAQRFMRAASELGARVALVPPASAEDARETGRVLGRLYDAVECQGLPAAVVERLAETAGVPVYDGLAGPAHPTAKLAAMLDEEGDDGRRFVLQATLLGALA